MSNFTEEERLKLKSKRKLWNMIFNSAVEVVVHRDRYKGAGRFTSTKKLLVDHLETDSNLPTVRLRQRLVFDCDADCNLPARTGISGRAGTPKAGWSISA